MAEFDADAYVESASPIGPRMALHLWCAARAIVDRAIAEPPSVAGGLPMVARRWAEHPSFMAKLYDAYVMVRERLALGALPIARCTGEEFALHIVISFAAMADAQGVGPNPEDFGLQLLPEPDDDDYAAAHAALFEDFDLLLLFDPLFDGIEDPGAEINQRLGIGPHLHPSNWFEPFAAYADADPLAPVTRVEDVRDNVLIAANDLAMRSGAREFTVGHSGGGWTATARYRGATLTASGDDPQTAATALVRRILEGARCTHCGSIITVDPGEPDDGLCHWQRAGAHWARGCEVNPCV